MGGGEVAVYAAKDGLGVEWIGSEVMFEAGFSSLWDVSVMMTTMVHVCCFCYTMCFLFDNRDVVQVLLPSFTSAGTRS